MAARQAPAEDLKKVHTPDAPTCEQVTALLGLDLTRAVKSIVLATEPEKGPVKLWLLLLRADHALNEVKAGKLPGFEQGFRFASEAEIQEHFGCKPGYLGPVGLKEEVTIVADRTVANMGNFVCGANEAPYHLTGVNWGKDLREPALVADIRNVVAGDRAPSGDGVINIQRGIEVGHVFYLGTKYSEAMKATFLDETGKPALMEMGCYGIGVTRIVGAAIEQNHDARGIQWPTSIAPFEVVVCGIGWGKSEAVRHAALDLYESLKSAGMDVILDDRDLRPGVMFAEWELIGVPVRITVGDRGLANGQVEVMGRRETTAEFVDLPDVVTRVRTKL